MRAGSATSRRSPPVGWPAGCGLHVGRLAFDITDDGVGFDPAAKGYGTGMQGMADRLAALGGELIVRSSPGKWTTVKGRVPVRAAVLDAGPVTP